jgi:hypothetical protein
MDTTVYSTAITALSRALNAAEGTISASDQHKVFVVIGMLTEFEDGDYTPGD